MRRPSSLVLLLVVGSAAAAAAWGAHLLVRGEDDGQEEANRQLKEAVAAVEAGRQTTPLIGEPGETGDVTVTFLARGDGQQVPRVVSDVSGWGEHVDGTFDFTAGAMTRIGKTDWYSLRTTVVPRARIEYQLAYAPTDYRLDPHNPRRSAGPTIGGAPASEFVTPGYVPPEEFEGPRPSPAGTVSDAGLEGPCRVLVYTPAGHLATRDLPAAVFLDLRTDPISRVLDWLIARGEIPPIVAALVGPKAFGDESCSGAAMAEFVTGPLLARLRTRYGVAASADGHAILGISYGAKDALEVAFGNPGAFRRVGLLVPGRRITRTDIDTMARRQVTPLQVAILAGRYDCANLPTAHAVRDALVAGGHAVDYLEVAEGHSAVTWRNHLREVLVHLFGAQDRTASEARRPHAR